LIYKQKRYVQIAELNLMNKITSIGVVWLIGQNMEITCGGVVVDMENKLKDASNRSILNKIKMRIQLWISLLIKSHILWVSNAFVANNMAILLRIVQKTPILKQINPLERILIEFETWETIVRNVVTLK
jgi:hypothetical protein